LSQIGNIDKTPFQGFILGPELQLAHAGSVYDDSGSRHQDEFPPGRDMTTAPIIGPY
jgi:hypothetical protein